MRCISLLDNILCRLDNACVHLYDSYDSTTDCLGPYIQQHAGYVLSVPNEMHFCTRQYSLSTRKSCVHSYDSATDCLRPYLQQRAFHCRLDSACTHSYDSTTDCLPPCLPNHMHFSTRQRFCPLVRLVRLDN